MNCLQKHCSQSKNNVVQRGLDLKLRAKKAREYLKWGSFNIIVLAVLLFDISNKCPFTWSSWWYLEYCLAVVFGLSVLACFLKYFLFLFNTNSVQGTKEQKTLLRFEDNDSSFVTTPLDKEKIMKPDNKSHQVNNTILSWHSSFNDSRSPLSPNWSYKGTPPRGSLSPQKHQQQQLQNTSWNSSMLNQSLNQSTLSGNVSFMSPYTTKYTHDNIITDERSLKQYLKEVSLRESMHETADLSQTMPSGSMNSFWNYCNSAANLLKTSIYQLAPTTSNTPPINQATTEEGGVINILDSNSELIKRISAEKLSEYVANLRVWVAQTILHRLIKEISNIDESFKSRGLSDMQIGGIGLERLKKTAENQQFVNQCMPILPLIVPFLEMSTNQEYLCARIKELAKGNCIAEYRWNSGATYHGLKWDEHLPTDSAILFHLFCVYLDSQLMPLPQGGGRPFFSRYVIMGDAKRSAKDTIALVNNKASCAILFTNSLRPRFNFISDKEIHNCANDRNNLFYVIIQFLFHMKTHHNSSLEGVNLGRSGLNIMCVIED